MYKETKLIKLFNPFAWYRFFRKRISFVEYLDSFLSRKKKKNAIANLQFIPEIKTHEETIDSLIETKRSICRFGDCEFRILTGGKSIFQDRSPELFERLKSILKSNDPKIMIGVVFMCWHETDYDLNYSVESWLNNYCHDHLSKNTKFLDKDLIYYDAHCTQIYQCASRYDFKAYYKKCRKIWENRDITVICGKTVFEKTESNIFSNAKSMDYIYAPSKNAFNDYENILEKAKKVDRSRVVLIILGPTATVLAYDLAKDGFQALDIGHLAKDYDAFLRKSNKNRKSLNDFFAPD